MDKDLELKITNKVNEALDSAENIWKKVAPAFEVRKSIVALFDSKVPSQIPDHPFLTEGEPEVADFIAFILDIRGSTDHLVTAISGGIPSQLERVFYETTAVNMAGAIVIKHYNGGLTEYLGDGFLAVFKINDEKKPNEVYAAYNAAKTCLNESLKIINSIIKERYRLPELKIGIGMAYSKAIITIVGLEDNLHPKVIGECVYRASKLSSGLNEILVDDRLKNLWPITKDGKLKFMHRKVKEVDGYLVGKD